MGTLLWEDGDMEYSGEVWLRPPIAACTDGKVIMCANAVKLSAVEDLTVGDVAGHDLACCVLDLHCIYQAKRCRPDSQQTRQALEAVLEGRSEEDAVSD